MVLREQYDLIQFIILITIGPSFLRYLEFHSNNWLHSEILTCTIEFECTIEIPRISDGNCVLFEFFRTLRELDWIAKCSLESIVCVRMKMNERHKRKVSGIIGKKVPVSIYICIFITFLYIQISLFYKVIICVVFI